MSHNCQGDQADSLEQSNQPSLCVSGCGFFANPACNNMCSKCYRDSQMAAERKVSNSKGAFTDVPQLPEIKDVLVAEKAISGAQTFAAVPQEPYENATSSAKVVEPEPVSQPVDSEPATTSSMFEPPQRPVQKNIGRCFVCNKKVGLTGFKCRCEYVFCGAHRLAEAHDCSFDYKQVGRQRLAENNPLVQGAKMDKL